MSEADFYADALREIVAACAKPFGKDARKAKRIATEALRTWGRRVDFIFLNNANTQQKKD